MRVDMAGFRTWNSEKGTLSPIRTVTGLVASLSGETACKSEAVSN